MFWQVRRVSIIRGSEVFSKSNCDTDIPELTRLARTVGSWHTELLAYFDTAGLSNGPTKAINLLIKKIKRVGHGFRNFNNYRLHLLLHYGVDWDTIRATPIRGRVPRLAA
jgi:hypothetical protein